MFFDHSLPTRDILQNSMAFRGDNIDLFTGAVNEVYGLTQNGGSVYSPEFPSWRKPESGTRLQSEPSTSHMGALQRDEAVAVRILLDECSALYQNFGRNDSTSAKISEVLNLPKGGWQGDATDGISDFGYLVGLAAGVRDQIRENKPLPSKKTFGYIIDKGWRDLFAGPLKSDNFQISNNVASAIIKFITESAEKDIPLNPQGAKGEDQIKAKIASKIHGAIKARNLYLEAKELANSYFSK